MSITKPTVQEVADKVMSVLLPLQSSIKFDITLLKKIALKHAAFFPKKDFAVLYDNVIQEYIEDELS